METASGGGDKLVGDNDVDDVDLNDSVVLQCEE